VTRPPEEDRAAVWDVRSFGGTPNARQLLERHLVRTGGDAAIIRDPTSQFQVALLRDFLRVLNSALDDELVDPAVTRRVLERVIYGSVPQPALVDQRIEEWRQFAKWAEAR
jgi:hypothetical protein